MRGPVTVMMLVRFFTTVVFVALLLVDNITYRQMVRGLRILQSQRVTFLQSLNSVLEERGLRFFADLEKAFAIFILNNVV